MDTGETDILVRLIILGSSFTTRLLLVGASAWARDHYLEPLSDFVQPGDLSREPKLAMTVDVSHNAQYPRLL